MGLRGKTEEYPQELTVRLTHAQRTFVDELAAVHGVKAGEIVRQCLDYVFAETVNKEVAAHAVNN